MALARATFANENDGLAAFDVPTLSQFANLCGGNLRSLDEVKLSECFDAGIWK